MDMLKRFLMDERGMESVEWGVMLALIVAGLVTVVASIGGKVKDAFDRVDGELPGGTG